SHVISATPHPRSPTAHLVHDVATIPTTPLTRSIPPPLTTTTAGTSPPVGPLWSRCCPRACADQVTPVRRSPPIGCWLFDLRTLHSLTEEPKIPPTTVYQESAHLSLLIRLALSNRLFPVPAIPTMEARHGGPVTAEPKALRVCSPSSLDQLGTV